jgi:hypothetical protein
VVQGLGKLGNQVTQSHDFTFLQIRQAISCIYHRHTPLVRTEGIAMNPFLCFSLEAIKKKEDTELEGGIFRKGQTKAGDRQIAISAATLLNLSKLSSSMADLALFIV